MKAPEAYRALGVAVQADPIVAKIANHRLLKRYHPDLSGREVDRVRLEQVVEAYRVVLEERSRIVPFPAARRRSAPVRPALYDPDPLVVKSAVRAIGELKVAQCAGEIASLFHRTDSETRHLILDIVERAVGTTRFQDVVHVGMRDNDPTIRKRSLSLYARGLSPSREEVG